MKDVQNTCCSGYWTMPWYNIIDMKTQSSASSTSLLSLFIELALILLLKPSSLLHLLVSVTMLSIMSLVTKNQSMPMDHLISNNDFLYSWSSCEWQMCKLFCYMRQCKIVFIIISKIIQIVITVIHFTATVTVRKVILITINKLFTFITVFIVSFIQ